MHQTLRLAVLASIIAGAATSANAASDQPGQIINIKRNGEQAAVIGPPAMFVGTVRIDPLVSAPAPSRITASNVTFEPGARSMWHTHPLGQTLVVTTGTGWVQQEGGKKQIIKPGDVIWTPPGVKHWHGATSTTGMSHTAIQESLDGVNVQWLEPVSPSQYQSPL